jgi:hypothetical protein
MTQAAPRVEKRREKQTPRDILAHIFMAAWICVLLQGALRKWVFPGFNILYLIQDVPLLMAYVWAFWKGLVWTGKVTWLCITLAAVLSIQTLLQIIFVNLNLRTAVIGLHHYTFYLPILFLLPVCYNFKHRQRFIRWNLMIIVPMALLAALQSRAPKGAWINRTSAGDDTGFGLTGDTVRATGTFNFTQTYSIWCGFAVGIVLGEWLLPPGRRCFKSRLALLLCTLGALLATMVSGSRTAVLLGVLAFLGGFASVVVTRNIRLIVRYAAVIVLLPVLVLAAFFAAPAAFNGVVARFSGEGYQEDLIVRTEHMFLAFMTVPEYSPLGVGIGYGIPAANPAAGSGGSVGGILLSEHETIRGVQEMGTYTGTLLVALRYASGFLLLYAALRSLVLPRNHGLPHALPLAFTLVPTLMVGELARSAPVVAPQIFFAIALILSATLFRAEPIPTALTQKSKTR